MLNNKYIILLFCLFSSSMLYGQQLRFSQLSVNDGLSQATVLSLLQDRQGLIWIGTADGLNKFNGYEFETFRAGFQDENGISDNEILALLEDQQGDIWIGTGNGLSKYYSKEGRFETFRHDPKNIHSLSNNYISSLFEDSDGTILIGTKYGLNKFDQSTQMFERIESNVVGAIDKKFVKAIYKRSNGQTWIGFENRLFLYEKEKNSLVPFDEVFGPLSNLKKGTSILCLSEDSQSRFWVGTNEGLHFFDEEKKGLVFLPQSKGMSIHHICQIRDNSMWIGTDKGLCIIDKGSMSVENYLHEPLSQGSLSNNLIHFILEDKHSTKWIGTGSGLNKYDPLYSQFNTIRVSDFSPSDFSSNKIWSIFEDADKLVWIGTEGGLYGLDSNYKLKFKYDAKNTKLSSTSFSSIVSDVNDNFWLGTYGGGLVYFDRKKKQFKTFEQLTGKDSLIKSDVIKTLALSRDKKNLWIGTPKGLHRMSLIDFSVTFHQFHSADGTNVKANSIITIYEDQQKMLWVGTEGGLICFEYEKDFYRMYKHNRGDPKSISHDFVRTVCQTSEGAIWIGTSQGLNLVDVENMTFQTYTIKDGLLNDVIYSIEEDEQHNLWLSTNKGLSKFHPKESRFENFDVNDGLQSNEFNTNASFKNTNGELFFGGINGLNAFMPAEIKPNLNLPSVYISSLETSNKKGISSTNYQVFDKKQISFSSISNYFVTIHFTALNYTNPLDSRYKFMLEGYDADWRDAESSRSATYTNLPGGKYTFRVKASNNSNIWNEEGVSLIIKVIPPFWKTWPFWVCVFLGLTGGVVYIFKRRVEKIEARNQVLEETVIRRTKSLVKQKKALEKSEKLFRSFYENSATGIAYVRGDKGAVNRCNSRLCEILGYSENELLQKTIIELTHPDDLEDDIFTLNEALAHKKEHFFRTNKRLLHKNGNVVNLSASVSCFWEDDGNLDAILVMFNDVTEEKAAQEQLLHANKMASLGQLTAGVAHEINNPVNFIYTGINGLKKNLKYLLDIMDKYDDIKSVAEFDDVKKEINFVKESINYEELREDITKLTKVIEDGAFRTSEIVKNLQTFSREDKNERQLADIHEGLDSTIQILNKYLSGNIKLIKKYDPELPLIDCFPGRLNQVFLNIIVNAIQAMSEMPNGKLIVETINLGKSIQINITNNGSEIDQKNLDRIFDPFFTTKEVGKGTGLGLSISYGIIKDHKGVITAKSSLGRGVTFSISLPLKP